MSARYTVELKPAAQRALKKITDVVARRRIADAFDELSIDPRPAGVIAIKDGAGELRLRVGHYRIVYVVNDRALLVLVVTVGHRSDVYKRMP